MDLHPLIPQSTTEFILGVDFFKGNRIPKENPCHHSSTAETIN